MTVIDCYTCQQEIDTEEDSFIAVGKSEGKMLKYVVTTYFCSEDCYNRRGNIKESDEGIVITSEMTGKKYRVFRWEDLGDGKIASIHKEEIKEVG